MTNYYQGNIPSYEDPDPFSPRFGDLYDCVRPFKCDYTLSYNEEVTNQKEERSSI